MKVSKYYILIMILALTWCLLIIAPAVIPQLYPGGQEASVNSFYRIFSPICHQLDSHSFHLSGQKLAVCARCSCVYFGFLLGGLMLPFVAHYRSKSDIKLWLFASVPMAADVMLDLLGIHEATTLTRILTGSLFGLSASVILVPIAEEAINSFHFSPFTFRRSFSWIKNLIN